MVILITSVRLKCTNQQTSKKADGSLHVLLHRRPVAVQERLTGFIMAARGERERYPVRASKLLKAWVDLGLLIVSNPDVAKQRRRYRRPSKPREAALFPLGFGKQPDE